MSGHGDMHLRPFDSNLKAEIKAAAATEQIPVYVWMERAALAELAAQTKRAKKRKQ